MPDIDAATLQTADECIAKYGGAQAEFFRLHQTLDSAEKDWRKLQSELRSRIAVQQEIMSRMQARFGDSGCPVALWKRKFHVW